jgi:hypothetical protein
MYEDAGNLSDYGFWHRFAVHLLGEAVNWSPVRRSFTYIFFRGRRYKLC